ncbi:MAG TPA: dUTP diphosphatase [Bacteroidales bacterium]|nr:dUTP diphosphatase [Bacteroidales bacterium]
MKIKIINKSHHPLPEYKTFCSSGMDIKAFIDKDIKISPLQRAIIPTGLFIEIPKGYEAQIRPRSGLAAQHGITVLNSPGTIDADYRGEIKVILINLSNENFILKDGERIAQIVFAKSKKIKWKLTNKLTQTIRNTGGFGHTGKY